MKKEIYRDDTEFYTITIHALDTGERYNEEEGLFESGPELTVDFLWKPTNDQHSRMVLLDQLLEWEKTPGTTLMIEFDWYDGDFTHLEFPWSLELVDKAWNFYAHSRSES